MSGWMLWMSNCKSDTLECATSVNEGLVGLTPHGTGLLQIQASFFLHPNRTYRTYKIRFDRYDQNLPIRLLDSLNFIGPTDTTQIETKRKRKKRELGVQQCIRLDPWGAKPSRPSLIDVVPDLQ